MACGVQARMSKPSCVLFPQTWRVSCHVVSEIVQHSRLRHPNTVLLKEVTRRSTSLLSDAMLQCRLSYECKLCCAAQRHPCLPTVSLASTQVFLTQSHVAIVTECARGGNMMQHLNRQPDCRLPEAEAQGLFQQLILGLEYCHMQVFLTLSVCRGLLLGSARERVHCDSVKFARPALSDQQVPSVASFQQMHRGPPCGCRASSTTLCSWTTCS